MRCAQWATLCTLCRKMLACVSREGRTGGGGWGHLQGAVHRAAARLGWPWLIPGGPIFTLAA